MEEKANFEVGRPQIIGYLPRRARVKGFGGFHFDNKLAVDNQVEPLAGNFFTFVDNWDRNFATDVMATIV